MFENILSGILSTKKSSPATSPNGLTPFHNTVIAQFVALPYIRIIIFIILIILMIAVILRIFGINSPFKSHGIVSEMNYIKKVKQHDAAILRANKLMNFANVIVEKTPFALSKSLTDYWQYNIERAGIKIPGGYRYMKATEFHSLIQLCAFAIIILSVLIMVFLNVILGWVLFIFTVIMTSYLPMMIIRQIVKDKDDEIRDNFTDFYLMVHYELMEGSSAPLENRFRSYARTTSSKEMIRFMDACIHYMDTYGEYEFTSYVAKDYREISEVNKLMRLIKQTGDGGDVKAELIGFKNELIGNERYAIERRKKRFVKKARASFNILMPILIQAIISAMAIYFPNFSMIKTLFGS